MTPEQIRLLRRKMDLSADKFGESVGLAGKNRAVTVYKWERGTRKPGGSAKKILEHYLESYYPELSGVTRKS